VPCSWYTGWVTDGALPPGGSQLSDPIWDAWRPEQIARLLAGTAVPWYVAGGWAIDLFRGEQTREHEDLEIGIPAGSFAAVRSALAAYEFDVVGDNHCWPVDSPALHQMHQTWVREPATGVYRLDIFREPHDGDIWICRRENSIRLPYAQVISFTPAGIPYLAAEIALLFKAKGTRPKDEVDFAGALPVLSAAQRAWLRQSLIQVHPGHPWIAML
jgi:Aminoglycoside-2''-adenylyltransferase